MFDAEKEENFAQIYTLIATFVELGLPNVESSNIYLAGVRSRSAALELSAFDIFKDKSISEIKQILSENQLQDCNLSEASKAWIELFYDSARSQSSKKVFFPKFTLKLNNPPDKLYLREANGECFLVSGDGYFCEKIESTDELPFLKISNIVGLYFEQKNNIWTLHSYNPRIIVE